MNKALAAACIMVAAAAFAGGSGVVTISLVLTGATMDESLIMIPTGWGGNATDEGTDAKTGVCPLGRYCPAGTDVPKMCALGTYETSPQRFEPCTLPCWSNYYCPDPGVRYECPANTGSTAGSTSQLNCRCKDGFQCFYKKTINLNVLLNMPLSVWLSDSGKRMKATLIEAVAQAAGVSISNVNLEKAVPHLGVTPGVGGGGSRRLLSANTERARRLLGGEQTLFRLTLNGAEKVGVEALQARLVEAMPEFVGGVGGSQKARAARAARAPPRVHWARVDQVVVKPVVDAAGR